MSEIDKLRILVLAPQPFFQHRGTPIAIKLLVEELALLGHDVHLLVFPEGEKIDIAGVTIHRCVHVPGVKNVPPSISWKKIVYDAAMFFKAVALLRRYDFDVLHAVEEAAFIAQVLKKMFRVPYIYDMDSSLPIQIVDKLQFLSPLLKPLQVFERVAVRSSIGVVAVCKALEDIAAKHDPDKRIARLEDISLLEDEAPGDEDLREKYDLDGPIMLYVGNLEGYQGIDLLFEGFQLALERGCAGNVVIIGGTEPAIDSYRKKAEQLGIAAHTYFCGMRPVELLGHYLKQADILLSPRIQGNNTPMKLYSYLDSGKAVLATNLFTHTQVLSDEISYLVAPEKSAMADGMEQLLNDRELRERIGSRGRQLARENYSLGAFRRKLKTFYQEICLAIETNQRKRTS
ncbi:glycosyltransferase family 4 protein [Desulforhopalus singaporensis]|uniref:Glycosyltransferase involved in cell wall bisynthesis n=1 Tax=Desulforhopalus singaporensis TaxID=91360 RepID=A0A1H0QWJ1_9BACT|nr:glycosyltransferase family 4 protein [Desulforhopalus singaporensis]SDP21624.1 Glycosyltransferase involved in cell wall bisynthesis [Desulforhopalus singaporensis]